MFSKKTIRIICLVTAIAMVVPICIGIISIILHNMYYAILYLLQEKYI